MNEYVAEYPRPPRIELISGSVAIYIQDEIIARDCEYIRVCETYHPPSIYIKPSAFTEGTLRQTTGQRSFCEWKGLATYWDLSRSNGDSIRQKAGWSYANPDDRYTSLKDWISIYPRCVDKCYLEGEKVVAQPGTFYGGWITSWINGPFKGDPKHPELM
jgi:uncharacterized protein (DUF427 family)